MKLSLNKQELKIYQKLNTPAKIQDFLVKLPANFEKKGETCYSPRLVLRHRKAQCLEGAIFAAAALYFHGHKPLIVDLRSNHKDLDHIIAIFKKNNKWGAISKTNHAVLRYREPVYRDPHELVMSYFHEYFLDDGRKTLRSYSKPLNLSRFDKRSWMTSEKDVWYIDKALDEMSYLPLIEKSAIKNLRRADPVEIAAGKIREWK